MATRQDIFNDAMQHYNNCIELIKLMDDTFRKATGADYDPKITLAQFDIILQAILLQEALADGNFDGYEQQFIDKITDYADLTKYIATKTDNKLVLSWSTIAQLPANTQQDLLSVLPSILDELCDSFVKPLAALDAATAQADELNILVKEIALIVARLAVIDGHGDESEAKAGTQGIVDYLVARWKNYMR